MIVVTTVVNEVARHPQGASWDVNKQGLLLVHDAGGHLVATYAAGHWTSARQEPDAPAGEYAG